MKTVKITFAVIKGNKFDQESFDIEDAAKIAPHKPVSPGAGAVEEGP